MMYIALLILILAGGMICLVIKNPNILDLNKDGKVDLKDGEAVLDINKDGKVDEKDLEIAKKNMKEVATTVQTIRSQVKKK